MVRAVTGRFHWKRIRTSRCQPSCAIADDVPAACPSGGATAQCTQQGPAGLAFAPLLVRARSSGEQAICRTEQEVADQVRRTVVHEIARHFGIDDDRLAGPGW